VSIAGEKAGIAKAGVPLVTQEYPAGETERIERIADAAGAPVIRRGRDWDFGPCEDGFWYGDSRGRMEFGPPALPGTHQAGNAALAVAMLRHQYALDIPADALAAGVRTARWPARLQRLGPGPVPALLPGTEIWIDGCHNPACAGAVAAAASTIAPPHALAIIAGILANKDAKGILAPFANSAARFATVPVPDHDHHAPEALATRLRSMGVECTPHASVAEAIATLGARSPAPEAVLVIGSLYLAGAVLRANGEFPD
jgi:dihydrofolate synthase/folylpolyglutamate synthase